MFLEYGKKELLNNKDNFNLIYTCLNNGFYILASNSPIREPADFAYSGKIFMLKDFIYWKYFGQSAVKYNKQNLKWLIKTIFEDKIFFTAVDKNTLENKTQEFYKHKITY